MNTSNNETNFPRYTNEESLQYMKGTMCPLLKDTTNPRYGLIAKITSLILARNYSSHEHEHERGESTLKVNCDKYQSYNVNESISGKFKSEEDVPEEFKQYARKRLNYGSYSYHLYNPNSNSYEWNVYKTEEKVKTCSLSEAESYQDKVVDGLTYTYRKNATTNWEMVLNDIMSGDLNLSDEILSGEEKSPNDQSNYRQFNKSRFHPSPEMSDFLTSERRCELSTLCADFGIYFPNPCLSKKLTILDVEQAVSALEKRLGLSGLSFVVDRKRKTKDTNAGKPRHYWSKPVNEKKDTFKCKYENTLLKGNSIQVLQKLPFAYRTEKSYNKAISILSILRGRLHNVFNPAMQANCLVIDKTGLSFFVDKATDPITSVFLRQLHGDFSAQKLFTIDAQMHGGIDMWLKAILDLLIEENAVSTQFEHIFLLVPSERTISMVLPEKLEMIYTKCIDWLKLMSVLFIEQWSLGVSACAKNKMMVPRSGTTAIHVNAWNACAGAWGNLLRFVKIVGGKLNYDRLQLFKVLKLTAGDQMCWSQCAGKGADDDVSVFDKLTSEGVMPWSGLYPSLRSFTEFSSQVTKACEEHSVEPRKWLGGPKERSAETKGDVISICGVVINPSFAVTAKEEGFFGSNPYNAT